MHLRTKFILATLALVPGFSHAGLSYENVIGKTFMTSTGSSGGTFMMSVSIEVKGRNTVEVTFIDAGLEWSNPNVSVIGPNTQIGDLKAVMINCKKKIYSFKDSEPRDNYALKLYQDGAASQWTKFMPGELIDDVREGASLTKYFETVCEYTS